MSENQSTEQVFNEIRDDFEQDNRKATVRAKAWIAVRIFLILFVVGYMTWIFSAVSRLDAQELTRIAAVSIEEKLPQFRADLRDFAIERAPELTDQARDMLLQIPGHLREAVEGPLIEKTDDLIVRFETDLNGAISTVIDDQIELIRAEFPDGTPEEQLDAIILGISDNFSETTREALDGMYEDYVQELQNLNARLNHLLRSPDLTESEKIDKQLIEAWMILVHRHKIASPNRVFKDIQVTY